MGGEKKQTLPTLCSMPMSEEKAELKPCSSMLFPHMEPHDSSLFLISFQTLMEEGLLTSDIPKNP